MDETWIQFKEEAPSAKACPRCAQRFSSGARFCPFDGEPLRPTEDWDPLRDPLLGSVVDGRYEVVRVIGEGGMGVVYEVKHTSLGRTLALKALKRELANDSDLGRRFIQEARAAAQVNHPNVVQITDFGTLPSGEPYFMMEMLAGASLRTLIHKGGPIPFQRGLRIARQVAEALAAAHSAGVIHRDLKPDNIHIGDLLGERDSVKVLDFGLAKVAGASRLTREGVVFGTPHYMSPEQALGEPVDGRADVYALGVVMYEMFTGRVPFEADSFMGVLSKHMYMDPTPPTKVPGSDERLGALEPVILRCLAKKPRARYQDMHALSSSLERVQSMTPDQARSLATSGRRASGRPNVLADALEAPSTAELEIRGLSRRPPASAAWWFGGAVAVGVVIAVLFQLDWGEAEPHPSLPSASAVQTPAVPPAAPEPAASVPVESAKSVQLEAAIPPPTPPRPVPAPRRAPVVHPAPKPNAPTPTRTSQPSPGGSEIINPWAE